MAKHILLIEDDGLLSEMYRMLLVDSGYKVTLVQDGDQALDQKLNEIDLVLLDIRIPEADGFKVLQKYRQDGFNKPIIILTNSPKVNKDLALSKGANAFIPKNGQNVDQFIKDIKQYLA